MQSNKVRLLSVALLGLAIPGLAANRAHPGTVNYVEGQVQLDGRTLTSDSVGSTDVKPGSVLSTDSGKAEILLTPGVFLRLGSHSEVRMESAGLTDTRVRVDRGTAMLEAGDVQKENHIQISDAALNTTVMKDGLYRFDANRASVEVFDGKASVRRDDQVVEAKKGKSVTASETPLKVEKFDRNETKKTDELYQWSSLRSKYLSEASVAAARQIIVQPGGWYGSGWYWNSFYGGYSWLPGSAYMSPFGYGFYSPWRVYSPVYSSGFYRSPRVVVPRTPGFHGSLAARPSVGGGMRGMSRGGRGR